MKTRIYAAPAVKGLTLINTIRITNNTLSLIAPTTAATVHFSSKHLLLFSLCVAVQNYMKTLAQYTCG